VFPCSHRKNTQCLELAKEAEDLYVKSALTELAEDFKKQAEKIKDR
jgi:hypothetical protein